MERNVELELHCERWNFHELRWFFHPRVRLQRLHERRMGLMRAPHCFHGIQLLFPTQGPNKWEIRLLLAWRQQRPRGTTKLPAKKNKREQTFILATQLMREKLN